MKKSKKNEQTEFKAATDIFHDFKEDYTYSKHQKSFSLALMYLEGHIFKRMQDEQWPMGGLPFLRAREIIDTLVVSAGEWGTSMLASQTRSAVAPADAETQMPLEILWRELNLLESDTTSGTRQAFEALFAGKPLLSSLLDYCVDYLSEILADQFPELKEYPALVSELLDVHVWTCARLEFIYSVCVPELNARKELIEKAFHFSDAEPADEVKTPAKKKLAKARKSRK
jgi:hypothetical protein